MNSSSVVLLEKDPSVALSLVQLLQNQFDVIRIETSCDSLREGIFKQLVSLAIIDVENADLKRFTDCILSSLTCRSCVLIDSQMKQCGLKL